MRHYGYDLTNYGSPLGPTSVYGLLNQTLFDPVLPVWFDNEVHAYRRVIKGSRNALNGAVDEGDEERSGPALSHNVPLFYVSIAEFGRVGLEYWVLKRSEKEKKKPSAAFVNPGKPIVLTLLGQNHAEFPVSLIRKDAELPYLTQRMIAHVDCNSLTAAAKRLLFVSNREEVRRGQVYDLIKKEIVKVFRSDDELARLNEEAKAHTQRERDAVAVQEMRQEVGRLLRLQGFDIPVGAGANVAGKSDTSGAGPKKKRNPPKPPKPIPLNDPPTYVKLLWDEEDPINFYPGQRRYIRIETDAPASYHNANDPARSRFNLIVVNLRPQTLVSIGSTPLQGGRMRAIFEAASDSEPSLKGRIRVELSRPSLPTLSDEREFEIVKPPQVKPGAPKITLPDFEVIPVGRDDEMWGTLAWPENVDAVASSTESESGKLMIYYSSAFPKYAEQRLAFERRDPSLAESFTKRYETWIAVHSLILFQDNLTTAEAAPTSPTESATRDDAEDEREREERCRTAKLAVMFAKREMGLGAETLETE